MQNRYAGALLMGLALSAGPVMAQSDNQAPLAIYFRTGSHQVPETEQAKLDQAARLFREGNPIVMIVAGGSDTVGEPDRNLSLSISRAQSVAGELVARGIPAERLQVLGRGTSELAVETPPGTDQRENRVVEISWR